MIDRILKERITFCIPTMNRTKLLTRCIKSYIKHCKLKTDFVIPNNNDSQIAVTDEIKQIIKDSGNTYIDRYNPIKSLGSQRKLAFDIAQEIGSEYIFQADDDCVVGSMAIEKMLAPMFNDDRFWTIAVLGGYKAFMRDFKPNEIRFHAAIGVLWVTRLSIINKIGSIDSNLVIKEDSEWAAKVWHNGGWTAIVDASVKHARHQPLESGTRTIPENYSEKWIECCQTIEDRYPNIFKNKKGKLYRQFKYPKLKFTLDKNLNLKYKVGHEH